MPACFFNFACRQKILFSVCFDSLVDFPDLNGQSRQSLSIGYFAKDISRFLRKLFAIL